MSRDRQIEEMAKDLEDTCENKGCNDIRDCDKCRAEWLYELGYRKASEVASESIDEFIQKVCDKYEIWSDSDAREYHYTLSLMQEVKAELKKKYEILNSWVELTHTCHVEIPHTIESIADLAFPESEDTE